MGWRIRKNHIPRRVYGYVYVYCTHTPLYLKYLSVACGDTQPNIFMTNVILNNKLAQKFISHNTRTLAQKVI